MLNEAREVTTSTKSSAGDKCAGRTGSAPAFNLDSIGRNRRKLSLEHEGADLYGDSGFESFLWG